MKNSCVPRKLGENLGTLDHYKKWKSKEAEVFSEECG